MCVGWGLCLRKSLSKRKQQISKEIPQRRGSHGKHFAKVEVPFQFAVKHIHRQRVDAQAYQGDAKVFRILRPDLQVGALECPPAVEEVVGGGCDDETQDIAQVFVPLQPFLANIGDAKVDKNPGKTDHAEFQEFQKKLARQFDFKDQGFHRFTL